MIFKVLKKTAAFFLLLIAISCSNSKPALDPDVFRNSVNVRQNPNPYHHQQPVYNQAPGYMPYVQTGAPPPSQYYYQRPAAPPSYQPPSSYSPYGGVPASRFYSNPYAIPPSNHQRRYYDADQYYVPPNRYNGVEPRTNKVVPSVGWTADSGDKP